MEEKTISFQSKKYKKYNSFIFKNWNIPFLETKYNIIKNSRYNIETFSLKSKNTQSISTGPDDKKDNVLKKCFSQKRLNLIDIIKHLTVEKHLNGFEFILNGKRKGSTPEKDANQIININTKEKKYKDNNFSETEKINQKVLCDNKNKKISSKKNNKPAGKIYKEDNSYTNDNTKISKNIFKAFPPQSNNLYDYKYNLSNNIFSNEGEICRSKISNVFFNHLVLPNNLNINNKITYLSLATIKRIKSKKLTILYFHPFKKL